MKKSISPKKQPDVITAADFRAAHVDQQEHGLQARCVRWFEMRYPMLLLFAVPNAGKRTKAERGRLIAEGMKPGVPDLHLAYPSGEFHGLWIEMKVRDGRPSGPQIVIQAHLRSQGYEVIMPRTFEEFQQQVEAYLTK